MNGGILISQEKVIVDDIMNSIITKMIKPGTKLPSENELAEKYRVPRMTVRKALMILEERGFIYAKQGKGRYLKEESMKIQLNLSGKTSFTSKMKQLGYPLKTLNFYCEKISYDPIVYENLKADSNTAVYKISRMRYLNNEPIAIHNSYVSEARFPSIKDDGPFIESMFAYYQKLGYTDFSSSQTLLSITFPTTAEQELLACKSMVPLMVVESNCIDDQTKAVLEHTKILYRGDKFKYEITID